jgi:endonuclease/exonuclease/phosphatase family metal-dependent hydrolase
MGRTLLLSNTLVKGKEVLVATAHLESLDNNAVFRYKQIKTAYQIFQKYDNVIMMGDFNFDNQQENQTNITDCSSIAPFYAR